MECLTHQDETCWVDKDRADPCELNIGIAATGNRTGQPRVWHNVTFACLNWKQFLLANPAFPWFNQHYFARSGSHFENLWGASRPIQAARTQIQSQQASSQACQRADLSVLAADGFSPSPLISATIYQGYSGFALIKDLWKMTLGSSSIYLVSGF